MDRASGWSAGPPGQYQGAVEACLLPDDEQETDAAWIAARIQALVAEKAPVRDKDGTRPVQYEDCCILLAARTSFPVYTRALAQRGIPVYADARENLFEAPHIRPLVALLKIIDNPAQDICLAAAHAGAGVWLHRRRAGAAAGPQERGHACTARWWLPRREEGDDPFTGRVKRVLRPSDRAAAAGPQPARRASAGGDLCLHRLSGGPGRDGKRPAPPGGCPPVCHLLRRGGGPGASRPWCGPSSGSASAAGARQGTPPHGAARPGCGHHHDHPPLQGPAVPGGVPGGYGTPLQCRRPAEPVLLHRVWGAGCAAPGRGRVVQDRPLYRPGRRP